MTVESFAEHDALNETKNVDCDENPRAELKHILWAGSVEVVETAEQLASLQGIPLNAAIKLMSSATLNNS